MSNTAPTRYILATTANGFLECTPALTRHALETHLMYAPATVLAQGETIQGWLDGDHSGPLRGTGYMLRTA